MKKFALLALALPALGVTFLACTDAGDPFIPGGPDSATVDIVINDTVGEWDANGLFIRGDLTGNSIVNLTQNGLMWLAEVSGVGAGTFTYGIYTDDGTKAEQEVRTGLTVTVSEALQVSGDTDVDLAPAAGTGFRLVVTNENLETYDNIKIKGSFDGWAATLRDGQSEDGVTVFRNIPADLAAGDYEWGVIHDDGTEFGVWLLPPGPNLAFSKDGEGNVTGDFTFTIESPQATIDLTFNCDMNSYLGSYDVVQVRGTFNNWNSIPTTMTDADEDGIYSVTVEVEENATVIFKFITDGANYESVPSECGVDDGYGGYNRSIQVGTTATSFTAPFASCPVGF